jgi:hypothetical protein
MSIGATARVEGDAAGGPAGMRARLGDRATAEGLIRDGKVR